MPVRRWEQYIQLGVTEIGEYGATSVQVTRRLRAALEEVRAEVASSHGAAVEAERCRLDATVAESLAADADRRLAAAGDRQGIGGPTRPAPSR